MAIPEGAAAPAPQSAGPTLLIPEPPSGPSAEDRARLRQVAAATGDAADRLEVLPQPADSVADARAAVTEPTAETNARAEAGLVAALEERPAPSPEIEQLCADIRRAIRERRPPDEDSLLRSNPEREARRAGGEVEGTVRSDADGIRDDYNEMDNPPAATPAQVGHEVPPPPSQVPTPSPNATRATPDPVPAENVSLDADVAAGAQRIEDAGMSSPAAELVQGGPIAEARAAHGELAGMAATDPAQVLAEQQAARTRARANMAGLEQRALAALQEGRTTTVGAQTGTRGTMQLSEEQQRTQAATWARNVFNSARTRVEALLEPLPGIAMELWNTGLEELSRDFEEELDRVERWKQERYAQTGGSVIEVWDELVGLPDWVIDVYDNAEREFGDGVCDLLREISRQVNGIIATCEQIIADADREIARIFSALPESLREWADGQQAHFREQLAGLHERVTTTRDDLTNDLADRGAQAVQEVRERIQELRVAAGGLVGRIEAAIQQFLEDPARFIINGLLELVGIAAGAFWALVDRIQSVIQDIAEDPLGFANNLAAAIGQGFQRFFDNFGTHILSGFFDWLFSGLGAVGVTLPGDFSPASLVTFFLELMGITWERIRGILARHIGEQNMALIEQAVGLLIDLIQMGPTGLFEMIKERLSPRDLIQQVIQAGVEFLVETLITRVAARLVMMFNPAGAILQAIEVIYRILAWIFNNAARIFSLVETVVNGAAALIAGNISGMAVAVEGALARLIAPVIDFLAGFLGLGALPDRIADTIRGFQQWILGIIERIIDAIASRARGLLQRLGIGGRGGRDTAGGPERAAPADTEIGETVSFSVDGESHRLWIDVSGRSAEVMLATRRKPLTAHLSDFSKQARRIRDAQERTRVQGLIASARPLARSIQTDSRKAAGKPIDSPQRNALDIRIEANEQQLRPTLRDIFTALGVRVPERIDQIAVRFTPKSWLSQSEYRRQLGLQERAINNMVVDDWIVNRNRYVERREAQRAAGASRPSGRHPESAKVQRDLRATTRQTLIRRLQRPANAGGRLSSNPDVQRNLEQVVASIFSRYSATTRRRGLAASTATKDVDRWMRTQHALHSPDQVAGGRHDDLTGLGSGWVNIDIGANWGGYKKPVALANQLYQDVVAGMRRRKIQRAFWRSVKMNVDLTF